MKTFLEIEIEKFEELEKQMGLEKYDIIKYGFTNDRAIRGLEIYKKYFEEKKKRQDFYNQKFDIGMLVNPVKDKYDYYTVSKYAKEGTTATTQPASINPLWQQAEEKRIFDGWEVDDVGIYYSKNNVWIIAINNNDNNIFIRGKIDLRVGLDIKLSQFIELCKMAGIELNWNPNNFTNLPNTELAGRNGNR